MPISSKQTAPHDRGICPISFHDARKFIQTNHAYLAAPRGCLFCIAAFDGPEIVAVAMINRPINPSMDDGVTAEISRLCTHNAPANTATAMIRRILTATRALGFHRLITYVDATRDGATFRAANFKRKASTKRRQWHGKDFCIPANASDETVRFEFTEASHAKAVTAVTKRRHAQHLARTNWKHRLTSGQQLKPARRQQLAEPRLFESTASPNGNSPEPC